MILKPIKLLSKNYIGYILDALPLWHFTDRVTDMQKLCFATWQTH